MRRAEGSGRVGNHCCPRPASEAGFPLIYTLGTGGGSTAVEPPPPPAPRTIAVTVQVLGTQQGPLASPAPRRPRQALGFSVSPGAVSSVCRGQLAQWPRVSDGSNKSSWSPFSCCGDRGDNF